MMLHGLPRSQLEHAPRRTLERGVDVSTVARSTSGPDGERQRFSTARAAAPPASLADELQKLAELHASGVLNDTEFTAARQRLIESP